MQATFYLAFQFYSALLSGKVILGISRKIQTWISLNCLSTSKLAAFVLTVKWFVRLDAVIAPFVTDVWTDLITIAHGSIIAWEKGTTPTFIYSWPLNAFTYSRLSWYPYSTWNLNFSTMYMLNTKIERTILGISTLVALEFSWLLSLRFSLHLSWSYVGCKLVTLFEEKQLAKDLQRLTIRFYTSITRNNWAWNFLLNLM